MAFSKILIRRDSKANWELAEPVLELGEIGFETDTGLLKVGNGTDIWSDLPYISVDIHDNTSHSEVYITASGVTYENLDSNGDIGNTTGTLCAGDDSRLSDARTPVVHDNTYHSAIYITSAGVTFENLNTNGDVGTGANQVCAGDDPRLSDARTPTVHDNTYHSETYITSAGVTFENLNVNGDIGTGTDQVAAGDHNHDAAYEAVGSVSTHESTYDHTQLHTHTNKSTLDEIEVAMKKATFTSPAASSSDYVLAATALADGVTTEVTTGITNPDMPRILSITGNAAGITGNVVIEGTNYNDDVISETITADGTNTVLGTKAFKTITKITLPAWNASGDEISIGIGDKLGLNRVVTNALPIVAKAGNVKESADPVFTESVNIEENLIEFETPPDGTIDLVCYFIED